MREQNNIDYCMIDIDNPIYKLYDKIIVYIVAAPKHKNLINNYISNNNILIIEDGKDILLNERKINIYNIINDNNINHIVLLHCNIDILKRI